MLKPGSVAAGFEGDNSAPTKGKVWKKIYKICVVGVGEGTETVLANPPACPSAVAGRAGVKTNSGSFRRFEHFLPKTPLACSLLYVQLLRQILGECSRFRKDEICHADAGASGLRFRESYRVARVLTPGSSLRPNDKFALLSFFENPKQSLSFPTSLRNLAT